jgi:hypothetical protein
MTCDFGVNFAVYQQHSESNLPKSCVCMEQTRQAKSTKCLPVNSGLLIHNFICILILTGNPLKALLCVAVKHKLLFTSITHLTNKQEGIVH